MLTVTMGTGGVLSPRPGWAWPTTTGIAKWAGVGNPGGPQQYLACIASAEKLGALVALPFPGLPLTVVRARPSNGRCSLAPGSSSCGRGPGLIFHLLDRNDP